MVTQPNTPPKSTSNLNHVKGLEAALNTALDALTHNIKAGEGRNPSTHARTLAHIAAIKALHVKLVDAVVQAELAARPAKRELRDAQRDLEDAKQALHNLKSKIPTPMKTPHLDKLRRQFPLPMPTDENSEEQHEKLIKVLEEELCKRETLANRKQHALKQKKSDDSFRSSLALYARQMHLRVNKARQTVKFPKNPLNGAIKK